jgi:hypothetical protein
MDHESFDRLARALGALGSRRAALGALFGAGVAGTFGVAEAAKKHRKRGKSRNRGEDRVSAQAVCPPPDHGVNRSNCDYSGEDFSGQEIHSSIYKNTIFRDADLIETDMHSSNFRDANFRGANLCGADLSSSNLRNADFRGFGPLQGSGRQTNLTLADLSSSACGGIDTNGRTIFCGTIDCNGNVRNDDCPGGPASDFCCTPCAVGEECINNECLAECNELSTITSCDCLATWVGEDFVCGQTAGATCGVDTCASDDECDGAARCVKIPCCPEIGQCLQPCPVVDQCACRSGLVACGVGGGVKCAEPTGAMRRAGTNNATKIKSG